MASFVIDDFEHIEFHIPSKTGKSIVLSLPPLDCVYPEDLAEITKKIEESALNVPTEVVRIFLGHFATTKEQRAAVDKLVARQLTQIDKIWTKESGITVGESEPSTDTSSEPATTE